MKEKTKQALRGLLESVEQHEKETTYSAVEVDKDELKRLLRWAQNHAHVYFEGDQVEWTGARVRDMPWLVMGMTGTVLTDSYDDGTVRVEWEQGPEGFNRGLMYHNEYRRTKA